MSRRSESPDTTFARIAAEYARSPTPAASASASPASPQPSGSFAFPPAPPPDPAQQIPYGAQLDMYIGQPMTTAARLPAPRANRLFIQQEDVLPSIETAEPAEPARLPSIRRRRQRVASPVREDSIWSIRSPPPLDQGFQQPSRDSSMTLGRDSEAPGFDANAAAAGDMPPPPPKKKRGPKPGSTNKGTVLRMPENDSSDCYYGRSVRRAAFDASLPDRKKALVHVGRIEETDAGEVRRPRCARCAEKGYNPCVQYGAQAKKKFGVGRCARCLYDGKPCK